MCTPRYPRSVGAVALAAISLIGFATGCSPTDPASVRNERAAEADGDLIIGVAWPWAAREEAGLYAEGLDMAVEEANAGGGVLGRTLRLVKADDEESVDGGRLVAQRFVNDPDVVAVIGHLNSHISIPAAEIYQRGGLLMLTPASTAPELTQRGHSRVFRSVHDDDETGQQLVELAEGNGWRRVYIVYDRTAYGAGLATAFEAAAVDRSVSVVGRKAYGADGSGLGAVLDDILHKRDTRGVDAIFLAGVPPEAGRAILALRQGGVGVPVMGGDALDTDALVAAAGESAEGLIVTSVFHPDAPNPEAQRFRDAFEARYDRPPDSGAARGYEAVQVLVQGMEAAGSAVPNAVAAALRDGREIQGVTGPFGFDESGDVVGKQLITVVVRGGTFEYHGATADQPLASAPSR